MHKHEVRTTEQALAYLVECTLATVSDMAMLKAPEKSELERQIGMAQAGLDWMRELKVDTTLTLRGTKIIEQHAGSVAAWAQTYRPKVLAK